MTDTLYLAEITVYDAALPGTRVLRYASGAGFVTRASESPASTYYDAKIRQPSDLTRDLFDTGTTLGRSRVGYGDLVLINDDGALDGLLEYAFDGWPITIRQGLPGAAYPAGFPAVFVGTMQGAEVSASVVTIKLRDRQAETDVPVQPTKYAGNNALPAGLEGVATDLKAKPKPIAMGSVSNIAPPCVNTSKLIYQVNDGPVSSVPAVYDRGVTLGVGSRWVLRTSPFAVNDILSRLCYGGGLFVAVGRNVGSTAGKIATSGDGITWTARTCPAAVATLEGVTYGGGLYVAVGALGAGGAAIITSPDGITWTVRAPAGFGANSASAIATSGALFVMGGLVGSLASSPDGITWTARTSGVVSTIYSICWGAGAGVFVLTADAGAISSSPDGITWTSRTVAVSTFPYFATFIDSLRLFLASCTGTPNGFATSTDGITWTIRPTILGTGSNTHFASSGTVVVAVNASGSRATSNDGLTWVVRSGSFNTSAIAYGGGRFVVVTTVGGNPWSTEATPYASLADLADDALAPAAGEYGVSLAGGYIRLGSPPAGLITADVVEGTAASDRTAAQCFKRALVRAGKTGADYSASDLTALDALTTAVLGLYVDAETPLSAVLTQIAASVGAWWGVDQAGVFRIQQFVAPSGSPVASFTANDLLRPLDRQATNDLGGGVPVFKSIVRWGRKWAVQTSDLAGSVTDVRRAELAKEWREASTTVAGVQTAHPLAPQLVEDSLLTTESDAQAEATRRQTLRGIRRDRFPLLVTLDAANAAIDLGHVVSLSHARFGLSAGKLFRVIGIRPDARANRVELTVWG